MSKVRMSLLCAFALTANVFPIYMVTPFFADVTLFPEILAKLVLGSVVLSVLLSIACIVFACTTHKRAVADVSEQQGLRVPILVFKLVMIPYFVCITVTGILMIFASSILTLSIHLASMGILFGLASIIFLPVVSVVNYLYLLATSSFSVSAIIIEYRKNLITRPTMIAFVVLQLLPVADVISYIFILAHLKKLRQMQAALAG